MKKKRKNGAEEPLENGELEYLDTDRYYDDGLYYEEENGGYDEAYEEYDGETDEYYDDEYYDDEDYEDGDGEDDYDEDDDFDVDDDDDDYDDVIEIECPNCGETICVPPTVDYAHLICPACNEEFSYIEEDEGPTDED